MTKAGAPQFDPVPIGDVAAPPFVRLADPAALFRARGDRFRALARGRDLAPYLLFLGALSDAQLRVLADVPEPDLPEPDAVQRARDFAMPPLDRDLYTADPVLELTLDRLLARLGDVEMPSAATDALARVIGAGEIERDAMIRSVLAISVPTDAFAEHAFVAAALQVHFARLAAQLDGRGLVPVGDGACPACGSPPTASMVVGWLGAHGSRYCGCGLCGTLWNYVRIKCTLCASTEGISYREIEGGPGIVKAETCATCRGYVKILQQDKDPGVDIVADDVASLGLDLLMRETGFRRGGVNPFLLGY